MKNQYGRRFYLFTLLALFLLLTSESFAQSTSTLIPIKGRTLDGTQINPATSPKIVRGSSYITITLLNTQIYQRTGLFQNLIEINRQAVVGFDISGSVEGQRFADTRVSPTFDLRRARETILDTGWNVNLIENLPTNFTGLEVRMNVSKSAKNGLSDAITAASEISGSTPVLTLAPEVAAGLGAAKAISDFLFNRGLLQKKIESRNPIDISGTGIPSGFYVVFAGKTSDDYAEYIADPSKLFWNGGDVNFGANPVEGVSYFVIQIKTANRFFPNAEAAPLSTTRAWANLYQQARGKIDKLNRPQDHVGVRDEIRTSLADARAILTKDVSLINAERNEIHTEVSRVIYAELATKLAQVTAEANGDE